MEPCGHPRHAAAEHEGLVRVIRRQNRYIERLVRDLQQLSSPLSRALEAARCCGCRAPLVDTSVRVCACGLGMHAECYRRRIPCAACSPPYQSRHEAHLKRRLEHAAEPAKRRACAPASSPLRRAVRAMPPERRTGADLPRQNTPSIDDDDEP